MNKHPITLSQTYDTIQKKANSHEHKIIRYKGVLSEKTLICWSFKCPYHAKVIKIFDITNRPIVYKWLTVLLFYYY